MKKKPLVVFAGFLTAGVIGVSCFLFSGQYSAEASMTVTESDSNVEFHQENGYYFFDSKNCFDTALIFYGGAKVEELAYSNLLNQIAESGTADVFLVDTAVNIPVFGKNNADTVMQKYGEQYENFYFGGHSMGGSVAEMYVAEHLNEKIRGLIFLASYSTDIVPDSIENLLYAYGDCDGILNQDNLKQDLEQEQKAEKNVTVVEIKGGNHAGFGNYGIQKNDSKAEISSEQQILQAVQEISEFVQENKTAE